MGFWDRSLCFMQRYRENPKLWTNGGKDGGRMGRIGEGMELGAALLDARKSSSSWKEVRRARVKGVKGPVLRMQKQLSFPALLPRIQAQESVGNVNRLYVGPKTAPSAMQSSMKLGRVRTCAARVAHANRSHISWERFFTQKK